MTEAITTVLQTVFYACVKWNISYFYPIGLDLFCFAFGATESKTSLITNMGPVQ